MNKSNNSLVTADEEQQMYMDIEKRLAGKNRAANLALTAVFFAFIFVFSVLFWVMPDREISEEENRALQTFPTVSLQSITDGSFALEFASYTADQFPFRNAFIGIKAACEEVLMKGENNGVIIGRDGYLVTRYDSIDEDILKNNIGYLSEFKEAASENGITVYNAFAGRTMDIAVSKIPAAYGSYASDKAWKTLDGACRACSLEYIDLKEPLRAAFENGEYVYYKTDHHWTTLGAFYAYGTLAEQCGLKTYGREHYTAECADDSFLGTTYSSSGIKWASPDKIEFFRWEGDAECKTTLSTGETIDGMYKTEALGTKDKYTAFLGGNAARCDVVSGANKETVIVVKDSFAHSLVPFLAEEYNVILIDLRYYSDALLELCKENNANKIFFIYNLDTLANESGFRTLRTGLKK